MVRITTRRGQKSCQATSVGCQRPQRSSNAPAHIVQGGAPETCEGGRLGPICAECAVGMYWAEDKCQTCEVSMVVGWIAVPCAVLLAMVVAYYVSEDGYKAKAALRECASIGGDMMLAFVQNLGILSVVSDLLLHETSWMELEVLQNYLCHWKISTVWLHDNVQQWFDSLHVHATSQRLS